MLINLFCDHFFNRILRLDIHTEQRFIDDAYIMLLGVRVIEL